MSTREFIVLAALLMSLVALSIDAMLPALPAIGQDLAVSDPNHAQLVVGALLLGLAYQPYYLFLLSALAGATALALRLPCLAPRKARWLAVLVILAPLVGNGPGLAGDLGPFLAGG